MKLKLNSEKNKNGKVSLGKVIDEIINSLGQLNINERDIAIRAVREYYLNTLMAEEMFKRTQGVKCSGKRK